MTELIEHGRTGFLVEDTHEAIRAIERIGELDRAVVRQRAIERFSVDRMADEYIALYRSVLQHAHVRND
jgi:glycosyltransferase involved in cell wall biosynthesis